jgi:hypothetical protein
MTFHNCFSNINNIVNQTLGGERAMNLLYCMYTSLYNQSKTQELHYINIIVHWRKYNSY